MTKVIILGETPTKGCKFFGQGGKTRSNPVAVERVVADAHRPKLTSTSADRDMSIGQHRCEFRPVCMDSDGHDAPEPLVYSHLEQQPKQREKQRRQPSKKEHYP